MRISVLIAATGFLLCGCLANSSESESRVALANGSEWRTASKPGEVHLGSGTGVLLSPRSSGTLYSDRFVLDEGSVRVNHFNGYSVAAAQFQIGTEDSGAQAVVRMTKKTVEVASLGGNLNVTDGGVMLTRIAAGTRASFKQNATQSPQTAPTRKKLPSDQHVMIWLIGITAAAALAIGLTAAAQGKSPF